MINFVSRAEYRSRIEQVVVYINEHLGEPLDLKTVAGVSLFSPYHFHRIFHGALGETPQAYINRLRVERAANFLTKSTGMTVTEVALICGFSSPSSFARTFKRYFGVSAREYTKGRNLRSLADACAIQACSMATGEKSDWNVSLQDIPPLHLAYTASLRGYSMPDICQTWERLDKWAVAHTMYSPATQRLGLSFDDPTITPVGKCRYLAAITVPKTILKDRLVGILDLPRQTCAVFHVECQSDQIQPYYQSIYKDWLPDSGLQPADFPCYDVYQSVPNTDGTGNFCMDIHIPVIQM
jgi:AraC family transcriptional regulator